VLEEEVIFD